MRQRTIGKHTDIAIPGERECESIRVRGMTGFIIA